MSITVQPSVAVNVIKHLMSLADQKLWRYNGLRGRLERLKYLKAEYEKCLEISETLTDEEKDKVEISILNKCIPVFHLAYYGLIVKDQIELVINIYRNIFEKHIKRINMKAGVDRRIEKKDSKKKILFCSDRLSGVSSVLRDRQGVIIKLSEMKDIFEIHCMTKPESTEDQFGKSVLSKVEKVLRFTGDLEKDIDLIIEEQYDTIVYCDINMSEAVSSIGLFRLAPNQYTTWGHSETSGMCDGYFINTMYEIDDGVNANHVYTEPKLFKQEGMGTCYQRLIDDTVRANYKDRSKFCLPKNRKIYLTTSSLFKMGSEMFDIFNGILEKDNDAIIVITKMNNGTYDQDFYEDLEKICSNYIERIHMIDRINNILEIHNLLHVCDVYLESYPFGNLNSSIECFTEGLPVITWPSHKMNGRFTQAFYKKMGISGLIVDNLNDYIDVAVKVANDEGLNKTLRQFIKITSERLFDDKKTIEEWKDVLKADQ